MVEIVWVEKESEKEEGLAIISSSDKQCDDRSAWIGWNVL